MKFVAGSGTVLSQRASIRQAVQQGQLSLAADVFT